MEQLFFLAIIFRKPQMFTRTFSAPLSTLSVMMAPFKVATASFVVFEYYTMSRYIHVQYEDIGSDQFYLQATMTATKLMGVNTNAALGLLDYDDEVEPLTILYRPRTKDDAENLKTDYLKVSALSSESEYSTHDLRDFRDAMLKVVANMPKKFYKRRDAILPNMINLTFARLSKAGL